MISAKYYFVLSAMSNQAKHTSIEIQETVFTKIYKSEATMGNYSYPFDTILKYWESAENSLRKFCVVCDNVRNEPVIEKAISLAPLDNPTCNIEESAANFYNASIDLLKNYGFDYSAENIATVLLCDALIKREYTENVSTLSDIEYRESKFSNFFVSEETKYCYPNLYAARTELFGEPKQFNIEKANIFAKENVDGEALFPLFVYSQLIIPELTSQFVLLSDDLSSRKAPIPQLDLIISELKAKSWFRKNAKNIDFEVSQNYLYLFYTCLLAASYTAEPNRVEYPKIDIEASGLFESLTDISTETNHPEAQTDVGTEAIDSENLPDLYSAISHKTPPVIRKIVSSVLLTPEREYSDKDLVADAALNLYAFNEVSSLCDWYFVVQAGTAKVSVLKDLLFAKMIPFPYADLSDTQAGSITGALTKLFDVVYKQVCTLSSSDFLKLYTANEDNLSLLSAGLVTDISKFHYLYAKSINCEADGKKSPDRIAYELFINK